MQKFSTFKLGETQDGPVKLPFDAPSLAIQLARQRQPLSFRDKFCSFFSPLFFLDQIDAGVKFITALLAMFVAGVQTVNSSVDTGLTGAAKAANTFIQICVYAYPIITCWILMTRAAEFNTRKVIY